VTELLIRKTLKSDIDTIVSIEKDNENSQFIFPNSKEEHHNLLTDRNVEHLVLKSANNETIGFVILVGLKNINKSIELRRIVLKEKGKGFGRMTIKELKRHCFEKLNSHRLWLDVLETNERAKYLYLSEGFKEEGTLRDAVLIKGKFNNLILMSILKDEYKNASANNSNSISSQTSAD